MSSLPLIPLAEAAAFTLGCAGIQALRNHAVRLTQVLVATVFVAVLTIAFAMTPDDELNAAANASAVGDSGMPPTFALP